MDTDDVFRARLETVFVKLLSLDTLSLRFVNFLGCIDARLLQLGTLSLQCLDLFNVALDLGALIRTELRHVDIWVLAHYPLLALDATLLVELTLRLIEDVIDSFLDSLIDKSLATRSLLRKRCITHSLS